jgi:hypothetical protein
MNSNMDIEEKQKEANKYTNLSRALSRTSWFSCEEATCFHERIPSISFA